ncbi:hypothetical protein FRC06_004326 [Ceratobasidium sp. 370]|nr:hypothetical protein FRC06_004326 [Ceratobasidium sp. 370]
MSYFTQPTEDPDLETVAEFTKLDDQRLPIHCQKPLTGGNCYNPLGPEHPPDGALYKYTNKADSTGYMICRFCKNHMDQKSTTITRRRVPTTPGFTARSLPESPSKVALPTGYTLYNVDHAQIRNGTNAAQRGSLLRPPVVAAGGALQTPYSTSGASRARLASPSKQFQNGPSVGVQMLPQSPGRRGGRKTSQVAFEIQTSGIPGVHASSTGPQLKVLVLSHAQKDWLAATFDHPLLDGMCTLRDKSGVDLAVSFPDTPALRGQCLIRGAKGQETFMANRSVKAVLMLTVSAYETVEKHIDECRSKDPHDDPVTGPSSSQAHTGPLVPHSDSLPLTMVENAGAEMTVSYGGPPSTPKRQSSKRAFVSSPTSVIRSPPTKRLARSTQKSILPTQPELPMLSQPSKLETALRLHGQHQQPIPDGISSMTFKRAPLTSIIASRSAIIHFFPISEKPLDALKEESLPLNFQDPTMASHGCILYNPAFRSHNLGAGTFKKCHKGKLVIQPIPPRGLGSPGCDIVAIKRPYVIPEGKSTPTRLPLGDELRFITQEATVWRWAVALLSIVYDFILEHPKASQLDGPLIPQLKFVQIGMAKSVSPGSSQSHGPEGGFLVEEYIPVEQGFTCFISNNSAQCLGFPTESYAFVVAQFCSFCQHVQWVQTQGRVFCTDWQGTPQIYSY